MLDYLGRLLLSLSILVFSGPSPALAFRAETARLSSARGLFWGGYLSTGIAGVGATNGCNSLSDDATPPAIGSHSVTLTWSGSVPVSKSPHGVILGYIVYRSLKSHDRDALPINFARITGTSYSDRNVEPGKTYYYTTRAVDAIGRVSGPSNEVRVEIPH